MRAESILAAFLALGAAAWIIPDDSKTTFTCGKLYYRKLTLAEPDDLFVGAMDTVYKLSAENISKSSCDGPDAVELLPENKEECIGRGLDKGYVCRNHIRAIHPTEDGIIYVCGTNAQNPKLYALDANLKDKTDDVATAGEGPGVCAIGPDEDFASVWVASGNPGDYPALYAGTLLDYTRSDWSIIRTNLTSSETRTVIFARLRTMKVDTKWLYRPEFVAAFEIGDYVYFFLREYALELMNCGRTIVSRVARICKQDLGSGLANHGGVFTSYVKARLNCSIPTEIPFQFDQLQAVTWSNETRVFYALFSTPTQGGIYGSAVCLYSLESIDEAFKGTFKAQKNWDSAWLTVPRAKTPHPRPGMCYRDSRQLPERMLLFHRTHTLMDTAIGMERARPIHVAPGVIFTAISLHPLILNNGSSIVVIYAGSSVGSIHKIVLGGNDTDTSYSYLVEEWLVADERIQQLETSRKFDSIYAAHDSAVTQISVWMCPKHTIQELCERDPYCEWDENSCQNLQSSDP